MVSMMFTPMDVYDAASSIGRECQLIVGEYGPDALQNIMPKIIYVLEELESCTTYCEKEQEDILRLQQVADKLREDKKSQADMRLHYEKSLEQMEQSWYAESQNLLAKVAQLEEENSRLAQQLASADPAEFELSQRNLSSSDDSNLAPQKTVGSVVMAAAKFDPKREHLSLPIATRNQSVGKGNKMSEEDVSDMMSSLLLETQERIELTDQENRAADLQLIGQLKELIAINYKSVRTIRRDLLATNASIDAAEEEVCRLARQSGQLMASRAPHRRQTGQLVAEKASLEAKLCLKERELADLEFKFSNIQHLTSNVADKSSHGKDSAVDLPSPVSTLHIPAGQGIEALVKQYSSQNPDDLVSMEELRYLLHERNELRCRLIELEEELKALEDENSKEPEVEGPMWPEPSEKLRPDWQPKSDIKTIFQNLLHRLTERVAPTAI